MGWLDSVQGERVRQNIMVGQLEVEQDVWLALVLANHSRVVHSNVDSFYGQGQGSTKILYDIAEFCLVARGGLRSKFSPGLFHLDRPRDCGFGGGLCPLRKLNSFGTELIRSVPSNFIQFPVLTVSCSHQTKFHQHRLREPVKKIPFNVVEKSACRCRQYIISLILEVVQYQYFLSVDLLHQYAEGCTMQTAPVTCPSSVLFKKC